MANKSEIIPVQFKADHIFDVGDNAYTSAYSNATSYTNNQLTTVNNNISQLRQDANSISATVKSNSTTINDLSGKVQTNTTDIANLKISSQSISAQVKSNTTNISNIDGRVTTNETNISNLTIKADGIESTVSSLKTSYGNNLFSFKNSTFENSVPFIQGYGFICPQENSPCRVRNLGFNGNGGDFVVSFDIYSWGKNTNGIYFNMCDVAPTEGNSIDVGESQWKHIDLHFNIPDTNNYIGKDTYNGFFDVENHNKNMAIRNFQVIRGNTLAEFSYSQDDLDDVANDDLGILLSINNESTAITAVTTSETIDNETRTVYKISYKTQTTDFDFINSVSGFTLTQNRSYTLSFYAKKGANDSNKINTYLYPNIHSTSYSTLYSPSKAGEQSMTVRTDGETQLMLDTKWRKFYIHFYNQSSSSLNLIVARIVANSSDFTLSISDIKFEEGFITDDYTSYKSLIRQTANEILQQVGDTYIRVGDGNITLNGDTVIQGDLTMTDSEQGFIMRNGDNTLQIKPTLLPSYNDFLNTTSVRKTITYSDKLITGLENTNGGIGFSYTFSKYELGDFKSGDIIEFGSLYFALRSKNHGQGNTLSSTVTFQIYEGENVKYTKTTTSQNTTIPNYTVSTASTVYIQISFTSTTSKSNTTTVAGSPFYYAYLQMSLYIDLPTTSTFVIVATNGIGVNFGSNRNVYIGDEGFVASYGNYKFRIDSSGFKQNNTLRIKYLNGQTYSMTDDDTYDTFVTKGNSTIKFPLTPYDGQKIYIFDKGDYCYINTNGKKLMRSTEKSESNSGSYELNGSRQWSYIYSTDLAVWIESNLG